jgi:hypothetical protein
MQAKKHVTYESLKQSARHYRGESGYCTVIMASLVLGWKFGKARAEYERRGRKTGQGTYKWMQWQLLEDHGVTLEREPTPKCQLRTVTRHLPSKGTFLVYSRCHVSVVRDGIMEDWATDSARLVLEIYKVVE